MEGLSLDLTQAAKRNEVRRYLKFVILGWFKMKIEWIDNVNLEQEMKNLACGDHWILSVVTWPVLRKVKNEEISYWQMVSCVSLPCFQWRSGGDYSATGIAICVLLARARTWRPRSSHIGRMGYLPWLMSAWLLVTRVCPANLVKERCYIKGVNKSLGGRWAGKVGRLVSWEGGKSGKGVWVDWGGKVGKVRE